MKLKIMLLAVAFYMLTGISFGQKGHSRGRSASHSSSHVSKSSNNSAKTVHVKAYTKKNGTHVAAYDRRPPKRH